MILLIKCCGCARFVMVLEEPGKLILIVRCCIKMLTHSSCMAFAQTVIKPFVIGKIKALLLHGPLHIPVDFSHEAETRDFVTYGLYCYWPEWLRFAAPGLFKDLGQDQHGHIASYPVALFRDTKEFSCHGLRRCRVTVIELQCVWPSDKERITAISENHITIHSPDSGVILRIFFKVALCS